MIISSLKIENFGVLKDVSFKFKPGVNLIVGDNGQGKSHVLKAIAFMLINHTDGTIEDYCNWKAPGFNLTMDMSHLGHNFGFNYTYDRKSNSMVRDLYIEDDYFTGQAATGKLKDFFDPSLCKASIISFQNGMNLVRFKPAERRDSLKKLYNLDFKHQIDLIGSDISDLEKGELKNIEERIIILSNQRYNFKELLQYPFTKKSYRTKIKKRDDINSLIEKNKIDIERVDHITKRIEQMREEIVVSQRDISSLTKDYQRVQDEITQLESGKSLNIRNEKLKQLQQNISKDFEKGVKAIQSEIDNLVPPRITKFNMGLYSVTEDQYNKLNFELKSFEIDLENVKKGICPTCNKSYDENDKDKLESLIINTRVDFDNMKLKWKSLQNGKLKNESGIVERDRIIKRRKELKGDLLKAQGVAKSERLFAEKQIFEEKKFIEKEQNFSKKELDRLFDNKKKVEESISLQNDRIAGLNIEIETESSLIPNIDFDVNSYNNQLDLFNEELQSYDNVSSKNDFISEENERLKNQKKDDEEELSLVEVQRDKITSNLKKLKEGKEILRTDFPNYMLIKMCKGIEKSMNKFIKDVYQSKYVVSIKQSKSGISVFYGSRDKDISLASGYEQQLFSLAYKYAFSKLSKLGILLLDEVDSFASESNSQKLYNVIGTMKEYFDQVFVITHKESVQRVLVRDFDATDFYLDNGILT